MTALDTLMAAGRLIYGEDWQRPIARALGPHHPEGARDGIDDRLVRRWAKQERPVPSWVEGVLPRILCDAARDSQDHAAELLRMARQIEERAPHE